MVYVNGFLLVVVLAVFIYTLHKTKVITIWKEKKRPHLDEKFYIEAIATKDKRIKEAENELHLMRIGEKILGYGSWHWDLTKSPDCVNYSDNFAVIFSIDKGIEFTGEQLLSKIHIQDIIEVKRKIKEAHLAGVPYELHYRICKLNRRVDFVKVNGEPILSEGGKTVEAIGTIQFLSTDFD